MYRILLMCAMLAVPATVICAQDNYEIQVYGSETVPRSVTMVELHNNFTAKGAKTTSDGTLPTHHAWHETIEVTHGFNDWFYKRFLTVLLVRRRFVTSLKRDVNETPGPESHSQS